jgi:GR25 family glycosyltransferase involved in LPS biosynthesis
MKVSQVTFINLDHRNDRLHNIEKQLFSCPFPTFKSPGFLIENYADFDKSDYSKEKEHKGIIGCFFSHKNAIKNLISKNLDQEEYSLILEDDVVIYPKFWNILKNIETYVDNADIIFFDTAVKNSPYGAFEIVNSNYPVAYNVDHFNFNINDKKILCHYGTHCYAIQNKKLNKIYELLNSVKVYDDIDMFYLSHRNLIKFCLDTGLTYQDWTLKSDIKN